MLEEFHGSVSTLTCYLDYHIKSLTIAYVSDMLIMIKKLFMLHLINDKHNCTKNEYKEADIDSTK